MKKLLVNTSNNIKIIQDKLFLSAADDQIIGLQRSSHFQVNIKGHVRTPDGQTPYIVWTVGSVLFGKNVFLRGVEEVAGSWQIVLDCSALPENTELRVTQTLLVGRVMEPVLLHRVGSDVAANGARILG